MKKINLFNFVNKSWKTANRERVLFYANSQLLLQESYMVNNPRALCKAQVSQSKQLYIPKDS